MPHELLQKFAPFFLLVSTVVMVYPILFFEYLLSPSEYLPYFSAVIEELIKCSLIFFFVAKTQPDLKTSAVYGLTVGGGYGFLENIIYALNYLPHKNFASILAFRFIYPFAVHINASIVFSTLSQKKLEFLGLTLAVLIHLLYNLILLA